MSRYIQDAKKMTNDEVGNFIREMAKRAECQSQFVLITQQSFYQNMLLSIMLGRDGRSALCLVTIQGRDSFNVPLYGLKWS